MKYLLTGAKGFIGSHLVNKLQGNEIVTIPHAVLKDPEYLHDHYSEIDFDYIIHLAAYGNMHYQDNEYETIQANIINLFNLLNFSGNIPYKGFINVSTSSVALPYETFYSATKGAGERIVKAFVNKYDKPVVNIRPFTVIGKGEQSDHLIPKLIDSCLHGTEIPFVREPVHDYIGVDDFCEALLAVMRKIEFFSGKSIDVGSGVETRNIEILWKVEKVTGKCAHEKEITRMRKYDSAKWKADPTILYELGWKPKQTIEEVIRGMV